MIVLGALGGVALVIAPALVRRWGRRLPPQEWSLIIAGSLVGGGLLAETALAVLGVPAVLRLVHGSALAKACWLVLAPLVPPAGSLVAAPAAALLVTSAVAGTRAFGRTSRVQREGRIESWVGDHVANPGWELVILPCDELLAFSAPGCLPQVVVSESLVRRLPADQLDAVVAHERAHLEHGHHRHLLLAGVVERTLWFVPGVRHSTAALRVALERWADEQATERVERFRLRDALASVSCAPVGDGIAGFGAASTVVERLDALDAPAPRWSLVSAIAPCLFPLALGVTSLAALASQGSRLGVLASFLGRCLS